MNRIMRSSRLSLLLAVWGMVAGCTPSATLKLDPQPRLESAVVVDPIFFDDVNVADVDAVHVQRVGVVGAKALAGFTTEAGAARQAARESASRAGANAFLRKNSRALVAVRLDSAGFETVRRLSSEKVARSIEASNGGSSRSTDVVQVKGYCRKDGVCVAPHTRAKPKRKGGFSR